MRRSLVMRRTVGLAALASALTACLLSIDESKIDSLGPDDGVYEGGSPDDDDNPYTGDPPVKDAEPPVTGDDGALTCSTPGLTLCGSTCYDLTGTKDHCGTCETQCGATETCKASKCTPPGSCKDLKAVAPGTATGVSNITVGGATVPVFCDMDTDMGSGFTLVYRISNGKAGDPYLLWEGGGYNDTAAAEATPLPTQTHYVSRLLGSWNQGFNVTDVRVRLYVNGVPVKELKFDAALTSRETWFSKDKMKTPTPWTDLNPATLTTGNVFSPMGHGDPNGSSDEKRRFLITKPYAGCQNDEGWLSAHGSWISPACDYEKPMPNIKIMYAPGQTAYKWATTTSDKVPAADSMAIFAH